MLIAALLFAASFEPIGFWLAAPIAYALFLRAIASRNYGPTLFAHVFIFAFVSSLLTLVWAGKYVGFIPLAFLALLHGLFYLPLAFLRRYTSNVLLFLPAILLIEEARARFPFAGFSWMRIAFSQADAPYLGIVSVGGVTLLSAWVLFISLLLTKLSIRSLGVTLTLALAPLLITHSPVLVGSISYAGVQGNTPAVGLEFNDRAKAVFNLHVDTTKELVSGKPDVIIWPENAIDVDPFTNLDVQQSIQSITSSFSAPLIAGAVSRSSGKLENISVMYGQSGEVASLYSKQYLTPFGEYIPLRSIARLVSPFVDNVTDFAPGERVDIHRVGGVEIAPVICFELLSDSLVRDAALRSQALVVQTNSATFAGTSESAQQLNITRIRAVENAREIVSISTIGISAHIDMNGRVTQQTPENVRAVLEGKLQGVSNRTLASHLGSIATPLALIISFLPYLLRKVRLS
jgi:apolipoprotein N-acyltransferase